MTAEAFRAKRRQKFLTEQYYRMNLKTFKFLMAESEKALIERKKAGDLDPFGEGGSAENFWTFSNLTTPPVASSRNLFPCTQTR